MSAYKQNNHLIVSKAPEGRTGEALCVRSLVFEGRRGWRRQAETGISLYEGFPFLRDCPVEWISVYKGFSFIRDFPVYGISLCY